MENLDKERPPGWEGSSLFGFVEMSWSNALATYNATPDQVKKLEYIDSLFVKFSVSGLTNPKNFFAALLFLRAHSAFRVASGLALATPTETYSVIRAALEYAGYAVHCHKHPSLAEVWLRRDDTPASLARVRADFTQAKVRASIADYDKPAAQRYQHLYEETVKWGAHPNEKALTSSLQMVDDPIRREKRFEVVMLPSGGYGPKLALRRCAQIGVSIIELFFLIFPERFELLGIQAMLQEARSGL